MIRQMLRDLLIAVFFALAASEHESFWALLDSRSAVVLSVGRPTTSLVAPRS